MQNDSIHWAVRFLRRTVPYNSKVFRGLYYVYIRMTSLSRLKRKSVSGLDIQIHAADHCNLQCRGCDAFSPLIEKCFPDMDVFLKDISRLSELTGGVIGSLSISGGEPTLHPELPEILDYARSCFPCRKVRIITNGVLLENAHEDFWAKCKSNNITISLTCYPINLNIDRIKELAALHDVELVFQDDTDVRVKTMYFTPLDPAGKQNIKVSYRLCFMSNSSFVLENGRLYTCPTIAHIEHFNRFFDQHYVVSENDYIDIYKINSIDEVLDFFCKPMPFCRYCNKKDRISGVAWESSKKDISEWS